MSNSNPESKALQPYRKEEFLAHLKGAVNNPLKRDINMPMTEVYKLLRDGTPEIKDEPTMSDVVLNAEEHLGLLIENFSETALDEYFSKVWNLNQKKFKNWLESFKPKSKKGDQRKIRSWMNNKSSLPLALYAKIQEWITPTCEQVLQSLIDSLTEWRDHLTKETFGVVVNKLVFWLNKKISGRLRSSSDDVKVSHSTELRQVLEEGASSLLEETMRLFVSNNVNPASAIHLDILKADLDRCLKKELKAMWKKTRQKLPLGEKYDKKWMKAKVLLQEDVQALFRPFVMVDLTEQDHSDSDSTDDPELPKQSGCTCTGDSCRPTVQEGVVRSKLNECFIAQVRNNRTDDRWKKLRGRLSSRRMDKDLPTNVAVEKLTYLIGKLEPQQGRPPIYKLMRNYLEDIDKISEELKSHEKIEKKDGQCQYLPPALLCFPESKVHSLIVLMNKYSDDEKRDLFTNFLGEASQKEQFYPDRTRRGLSLVYNSGHRKILIMDPKNPKTGLFRERLQRGSGGSSPLLDVLQSQLKPMKLAEVASDGDCFFHAVGRLMNAQGRAPSLAERQDMRRNAREGVVGRWRERHEEFKLFSGGEGLMEYYNRTADVGVWADQILIDGFCHYYKIVLDVWQWDRDFPYEIGGEDAKQNAHTPRYNIAYIPADPKQEPGVLNHFSYFEVVNQDDQANISTKPAKPPVRKEKKGGQQGKTDTVVLSLIFVTRVWTALSERKLDTLQKYLTDNKKSVRLVLPYSVKQELKTFSPRNKSGDLSAGILRVNNWIKMGLIDEQKYEIYSADLDKYRMDRMNSSDLCIIDCAKRKLPHVILVTHADKGFPLRRLNNLKIPMVTYRQLRQEGQPFIHWWKQMKEGTFDHLTALGEIAKYRPRVTLQLPRNPSPGSRTPTRSPSPRKEVPRIPRNQNKRSRSPRGSLSPQHQRYKSRGSRGHHANRGRSRGTDGRAHASHQSRKRRSRSRSRPRSRSRKRTKRK